MRIKKLCKQDIIQCEKVDNRTYIKRQYTLDGVLKQEKTIDVNLNKIGNKYVISTDQAFQHLIDYNGYEMEE